MYVPSVLLTGYQNSYEFYGDITVGTDTTSGLTAMLYFRYCMPHEGG